MSRSGSESGQRSRPQLGSCVLYLHECALCQLLIMRRVCTGRPYANPSMRLPADPATDVPRLARVTASLPDVRLAPAASAGGAAPPRGPAGWAPPAPRVSAPALGRLRKSGPQTSTRTTSAPWVASGTSALPWGRGADNGGSPASTRTVLDSSGSQATQQHAGKAIPLSATMRTASAPCLPQQRVSAPPLQTLPQQQEDRPGLRVMKELADGLEAQAITAASSRRGSGKGEGGREEEEEDTPEGSSFPETLDGYVLQVTRSQCLPLFSTYVALDALPRHRSVPCPLPTAR